MLIGALANKIRSVLRNEKVVHQLEFFLPENARKTIAFGVPNQFLLRPYTHSDQQAILDLMKAAGFDCWNGDTLKQAMTLCVPDGFILLIDGSNGNIVSTMMARHLSDQLHPYGGRIDWLAADPNYQGKGAGYLAAAAVVNRLIEINYRYIYVTTDDFRLAAIKTFLKIGFLPNLYRPEMYARWEAICQKLAFPFEPESWNTARLELLQYCEYNAEAR